MIPVVPSRAERIGRNLGRLLWQAVPHVVALAVVAWLLMLIFGSQTAWAPSFVQVALLLVAAKLALFAVVAIGSGLGNGRRR